MWSRNDDFRQILEPNLPVASGLSIFLCSARFVHVLGTKCLVTTCYLAMRWLGVIQRERQHNTTTILSQVDTNKITATDYAVYVEGLPKTAGRKDIGQFFR